MAGSPDTEPSQHLGLLRTFRSALACKDITTDNSETLRQIILKATPIGVSTYRVTRELPAPIREELPSVEDLQEVVTKLRSEMDLLRQERQDE
jgi:hypothetical protein